ncbi:hypothetical protein J41TS12_19890 [Paenibacillus antibioticophila]|uniref:Uncharacterized protein n=1 Tax=Paenibacillus antibioticophila TaxID=1274374 RepID=A0A919XVC9_9BACL|nr:hypothetical protein J41TS12_19890 [Paenibacillus antibioticophila]
MSGSTINYSYGHLGINTGSEEAAFQIAQQFSRAFGFEYRNLTLQLL